MEKTIYGGKPNNPVGYCCLHCGLLTLSWETVPTPEAV